MPDSTAAVDADAPINSASKAEENKAATDIRYPGTLPSYRYWRHGWRSHLHPNSTKDMPTEGELGTGGSPDDRKIPNHPKREQCRHGWGRLPHPEWKENMPVPSGYDVTNADLTAEHKERFAQYRRWKMYETQRFSEEPSLDGEKEQSNFPAKFDRRIPGDLQSVPPFPFYSPYHHGFHCGGRFHAPKPTLQERLQREFDFI